MQTLIILHGWGSSKEKWEKVKGLLEEMGLRVLVPDIPGFKPETELKEPWNLDNYLEWFEEFLAKQKAASPGLRRARPEHSEGVFLLGHSFGGRVALKFASKQPEKLKGLILVSSAGIKRPSFKVGFFKRASSLAKKCAIQKCPLCSFFKKVFYRYVLRTTDYLKAQGHLRETIKNILAEDLTPLLSQITTPTLLIWGERDKDTPLKDARLMQEEIKSSRLEVLKGIGHAPHLENPEVLAGKIKGFLWK